MRKHLDNGQGGFRGSVPENADEGKENGADGNPRNEVRRREGVRAVSIERVRWLLVSILNLFPATSEREATGASESAMAFSVPPTALLMVFFWPRQAVALYTQGT